MNTFESPSPVLHVRSVPPETTENDLVSCIQTYTYGRPVVAVRILEKFQQALVETDSVETASRIVNFGQEITLHGKPIQISFSKSKSINNRPIGNVLLCTIENANMSINVDVLHHFFSLYGEVLRIVIFTKNNLQALVEFGTPDSAFNAKKHLHNASMYQGGICVLKIEISKTERLNVTVNNDRTRDYTKNLPSVAPTSSSITTTSTSNNNNNNHNNAPTYYPQSSSSSSSSQSINGGKMIGGVIPPRTTVLMIYGLDENIMTCERIFNLFCVYGNVQKIKVLPAKKGTAMVQMEDAQQADTIINYYNQINLFGQPLHIMYSKHQSITDSHNPESANNSRDFTNTPFKRFTHSISTYKHLYKPSQTLYFSNVPKDFTESAFIQLFASMNTHKPIGIKNFTLQQDASSTATTSTNGTNGSSPSTTNTATTTNKPTDNKIVGLLEFSSPQHALEALVYVNNAQVPGTHQHIRLSFSNSTVLPQPPRASKQSSHQI